METISLCAMRRGRYSCKSTVWRDAGVKWVLWLVSSLTLMGLAAACQPVSSNKAESNSIPGAETNAPPGPAPVSAKPDNAASGEAALTLPVLDAFFAQEHFADDLKAKLQLTDQQIDQLRAIARQETSRLRESDNDDGYGSAAAAREQASEKIKSAIGDQRTKDLVAFVSERWSGNSSDTPTSSASPSAIPQDTRIVINAPAFRMDIFSDGQLIKSYRIGIGYPEFPLPTGLRKADTIIFNPSWTPPDEPWVESSHSDVKVGEKVPAGSKLNPLGPIKIPIGLPSLIHGGKAPAKLGGFASHGCVGLTTPQVEDFAERLAKLTGTNLSRDQIVQFVNEKTETKPFKLTRAIPVELRYDTITVEDGKLHIYRDVYERGANTEENLRKVLLTYGVNFDQLDSNVRTEMTGALGQMSRDAKGKPVVEAGSRRNPSKSGAVTRTIRGLKESVIDIPGLEGKGYPAPVDLDTGARANVVTSHPRRRR